MTPALSARRRTTGASFVLPEAALLGWRGDRLRRRVQVPRGYRVFQSPRNCACRVAARCFSSVVASCRVPRGCHPPSSIV
ncbi:hypothetical protein Micbo1qcDRAFT_163488, partial [Microdochium bolleyi]